MSVWLPRPPGLVLISVVLDRLSACTEDGGCGAAQGSISMFLVVVMVTLWVVRAARPAGAVGLSGLHSLLLLPI